MYCDKINLIPGNNSFPLKTCKTYETHKKSVNVSFASRENLQKVENTCILIPTNTSLRGILLSIHHEMNPIPPKYQNMKQEDQVALKRSPEFCLKLT